MQNNSKSNPGFTLVEIMIVIVIIGILVSIGSGSELIGTQENKKLEQVSRTVLSVIDETKLDALLGKTKNGEIVRKKKLSIAYDTAATSVTTTLSDNLAKNDTNSFEPGEIKASVSLPRLAMMICPTPTSSFALDTLEILFTSGEITFAHTTEPEVVIKLGNNSSVREIHIDRRTGLTYEQDGTDMSSCGSVTP